MKNVWCLLLLMFFFSGCSNNNSVPQNILPEDTMIQIIVDMHIADAILIEPSVQQKQLVISNKKFYTSVLTKHHLTKEEFQNNIDFYSDDPEKFDLIYERVIEELTIIQGNIMGNDSLKATPVK